MEFDDLVVVGWRRGLGVSLLRFEVLRLVEIRLS